MWCTGIVRKVMAPSMNHWCATGHPEAMMIEWNGASQHPCAHRCNLPRMPQTKVTKLLTLSQNSTEYIFIQKHASVPFAAMCKCSVCTCSSHWYVTLPWLNIATHSSAFFWSPCWSPTTRPSPRLGSMKCARQCLFGLNKTVRSGPSGQVSCACSTPMFRISLVIPVAQCQLLYDGTGHQWLKFYLPQWPVLVHSMISGIIGSMVCTESVLRSILDVEINLDIHKLYLESLPPLPWTSTSAVPWVKQVLSSNNS